MLVAEIETPALLVDAGALDRNIAAMAQALPGDRLRPHVKAHKCTSLARHQAAAEWLPMAGSRVRCPWSIRSSTGQRSSTCAPSPGADSR